MIPAAELKAQLDIVAVIGSVVELRKRGQYFMARCPFHTEDTASFVVYSDRFKCYGCGVHGDVFDFVAMNEKIGFAEAAARLESRTSLSPVAVQPSPPKPTAPPKWQRGAAGLLARWSSHPQRLALWRQYSPLMTADVLDRYALGVGVLPSCICQHPRLVYPVFADDGTVIALRGRSIDCGCGKFLNAAGSAVALWSAQPEAKRVNLIVTESPLSAMLAMTKWPTVYAVAGTGGAATWRAEWSKQLAARQWRKAVVWFDHDAAGRDGAELVRQALATGCVIAKVWAWEEGTPHHYDLRDYLEGKQ